ncbi:hypothetical protein ACQ4PT_007109 [Festuca glaucescens]
MTVTEALGERDGDPADPPPARVLSGQEGCQSPERRLGGRFWVLQSSNDEDDSEGEATLAARDTASLQYLCQTPLSVADRDLSERSSMLARRQLKRINRQHVQRMTAMAAMELDQSQGTWSPSSMPVGMFACKSKVKDRPVLEPTVFVDDGGEGWTVVRRRRWSPAIVRHPLDPIISQVSKTRGVGLTGIRAEALSVRARWGPNGWVRRKPVNKVDLRSDAAIEPKQVRVGAHVAGRDFRNLLGLAWKRIETGEPVVSRQHAFPSMNGGDGGQGSFNPGRGGFNVGRGGQPGRGGFGTGRGGANGRGWYGGRGAQGFGAGQGSGAGQGFGGGRGAHAGGFGRNYVQGEPSGTIGMNSNNGYQEENWGGGGGHFQRGVNRFSHIGYNNQQRWNNSGRGGFQQNYRNNGQAQPVRSGLDADLLQQTVQAVVAAVTAAQRTTEPVGGTVVPASGGNELLSGVPSKNVVAPAAAPTTVQQQVEATTQILADVQEGGSKGKETEGHGHLKKKKEDKTGCFRCKQPGHYIDDCPIPFCDLCESVNHVASACHLLHAPKPTATMHGYANEALMFFELPCGAFKAKVENPKFAKVTVDGNAMTIPEIIEQLKRIVPSEKFNWEVFHLKDNIFRVKLPSKQEVQRLKNFGTYICQDRESCLSFDLWSSLEEPLYMLPEVWVRVSGLPSDMRSDYLSLWGVGTLFGKTLDVDMAFTRGGFFKLRFEVETVNGSQEVNMVEATNGNDGNDGAHNGDGNNGNGNAMDMDHRGTETEATSNNNGNDASNVNNGIDGMQEQLQQLDAIQIGSLNVKLNSGSPYSDSILSQNEQLYMYLSSAENVPLKNKNGADCHADPMTSKSGLGLPMVGARDPRWSADGQQQGAARGENKQRPRAQCGRMHAQSTPGGAAGLSLVDARRPPSSPVPKADETARTVGHSEQLSVDSVQQVQRQAACIAVGDAGSFVEEVAVGGRREPVLGPQKIWGERESLLPSDKVDGGNDGAIMTTAKPMIGAQSSDFLGSSVHQNDAANGMGLASQNFNAIWNDNVDIRDG